MRSPAAGPLIIGILMVGISADAAGEAVEGYEPDASDRDPRVEEITVTTHRVEQDSLRTPSAVGVVGRDAIQRGQRQLTLGEALPEIPGIFVQNLENFAQDTRISIRGFGARSAFGVRGIEIRADGIPLSLPDGQGQVDTIDLSSAGTIEVMRGPSGSLYGSSAGGVIDIRTEDGPPVPYARGRVAFGDYGYRDYQAKAGGRTEAVDSLLSLSGKESDGYRDHSRMENLLLNTRFRFELDSRSELMLVVRHLHAPRADDPGALDAAAVAEDRRQARPANVAFDAGESIEHTTFGARYDRTFAPGHQTTLSGFFMLRDFENRLPFSSGGAVDLDRFFAGGSAQHTYGDTWWGRSNRLLVGLDVEAQLDERARYDNDFGSLGALTLDQEEEVLALGIFVQDELQLWRELELTASVRFDRIDLSVEDRFLADGDDSGGRDFNEWTFMAALLWGAAQGFNPYVKVANSFEVPSTTELANPDGGGGFNPDLEPEKATSFELGAKGLLPGRIRYDLALYYLRLRDELVPFESAGGRVYFENAGRSHRTGVELGLAAKLAPGLGASLVYTFSDFKYDEFGSFDGNALPGIPRNVVRIGLSYEHPVGFFASWSTQFVDRRYANNANTAAADAYAVSHLRFGMTRHVGKGKRWEVSGFVGLDNVAGAEYIDNVRINAFGGYYYEPASELTSYAGLALAYRFGDTPTLPPASSTSPVATSASSTRSFTDDSQRKETCPPSYHSSRGRCQ